MRHIFRLFVKITGYLSMAIYFKPKVYYQNKKVQGRHIKKRAIIMSNHKAPLDFMFVFYLFITRSIHCVVAETIYEKNKLVKWILNMLGSIKTDRFSKDLTFINESVSILNKGGVIEIYPESRLPIDEQMLPFNPSIIYIALQGNAPIIPIYHTGNYGFFKRQKVMIGTPIHPRDFVSSINPTKVEIENFRDNLERIMHQLKDALQERLHRK